MKPVFAAIAISAFCCFSVHAADAGQEAEMKSQLSAMTAAFNKSDPKAVAEFFAMDATLINPQGTKASGRQSISELLQKDLNGILKAGKTEIKFGSMRSLGPDTAFVDSIHEISIKTPTNVNMPPLRIQFSGVVKKTGGKWLWLDARPYTMMMMPMHGAPGGPPPPMPHGMPPNMKGMGKMSPPGGPPGPPPTGYPPGVQNTPPPGMGQVPKTKGN